LQVAQPSIRLINGRLDKFCRDEYTLAAAAAVSRCSFEIEYRASSGSFADHSAYFRVFLQLLMIRADCVLAAPHYASHSLTTIESLRPKEIAIQTFNPEDTRFGRENMATISLDSVKWTSDHLHSFLFFPDKDRLLLAFHALSVERFAHIASMSLLTVWSGLEALFSIEHEQTFRLSLMASYYLETEPAARKVLFDQMRAAYATRSAVTHGRKKKPEEIAESATWVASILRRCMVRAVETKKVPTTNDLFFS
jgi:Apea-like HEPN